MAPPTAAAAAAWLANADSLSASVIDLANDAFSLPPAARASTRSSAEEGKFDGRWPFPAAPRGQDANVAPHGAPAQRLRAPGDPGGGRRPASGAAAAAGGTPTASAAGSRSGARKRATSPKGRDPEKQATCGGGPGQFFRLRPRQPEESPGEWPFHDLDNAGGKYKTLTTQVKDLPQRHALMRSYSEPRFRGLGGRAWGLYMSTGPELGPGQHVQHKPWIDEEEPTRQGDQQTVRPQLPPRSPTAGSAAPSVAASPTAAAAASPLALSPSAPVLGASVGSACSPTAGGTQRRPDPNVTSMQNVVFRSSRPRMVTSGPDSWMVLSHRTREVDDVLLNNDDRQRRLKFNKSKKGALFMKGERKVGSFPVVKNARFVGNLTATY